MFRRIKTASLATLLVCLSISAATAATLSPTLAAKVSQLSDAASVGTVIVAFNTGNGLTASHLNILRGVGITKGRTLQHLGMVAVTATAGQVRALTANSSVRSIWSNVGGHQ